MNAPLLTVRQLQIHFRTHVASVEAVKNSSFEIYPKEVIGIIGESGSGKSATAQAILQLLPKNGRITSGEILFEGENLLSKSEKEMESIRGKKIGMIFQDPLSSLNPTMTIGYQIMEGLIKHDKLSNSQAYEKAIQLLDQVGIADAKMRMSHYPHQLSGGMRQRVMMAMALACYPILLIADEPTTPLDVTIQAQILDLLKRIQQERGISLLLISHDLGVIASLCDRVIVMHDGNIVERGSVEQIFYYPQHPYTQTLIGSHATCST